MAKVGTIEDPGHPAAGPGVTYSFHSVITGGTPPPNEHCIAAVLGWDMSPLDADPEIVSLFNIDDVAGHELQAKLLGTARAAGMSDSDVSATKVRVVARGGDFRALAIDTPLCEYIHRVADTIVGPGTDIRPHWKFRQRAGR